MITDDSSIFDVLGDFFYHHEEAVRAAALEVLISYDLCAKSTLNKRKLLTRTKVYIRRAFISYEVTGVTNLKLEGGSRRAAVKFDFLLPQTHPNM